MSQMENIKKIAPLVSVLGRAKSTSKEVPVLNFSWPKGKYKIYKDTGFSSVHYTAQKILNLCPNTAP